MFTIILYCFYLIVNCCHGYQRIEPVNSVSSNINRSFVIDYDNNVFLKDRQPFRYISGSFHYFQAPRASWRDRFQKMRAAGLNAVSTYIEWSSHESSRGHFNFEGDQDIEYFLQLAEEEGLLVILRPGPYICAERDFGGLPFWLLSLYPNIKIRSSDADFKSEVKRWYSELFKRLQTHLYGNGGPIIMVQVENEYGSYVTCDIEYRIFLRDEILKYVRKAAVLFTTDGPGYSYLKCGHVPGVYATIDFGVSDYGNVTKYFAAMREYSPKGPLVNSEFYTGWFSNWEERRVRVATADLLAATKILLDMKANFNFYMFFGGTNFGFTNGANSFPVYRSVLTSYDFDAPLDEAGDCTPKYYAIRDLISKYHKLPNIPLARPTPKGKYGKVRMEAVLSIFNTSYIDEKIVLVSEKPKTFEQMNLGYGYMLYETTIPNDITDPVILTISDVRDRAIVYINQVPVGILIRDDNYTLPLVGEPGKTLRLLVENRGRVDYGEKMKDIKGLLSVPLLNKRPLINWTMTGLPFKNVSWVPKIPDHGITPPALYVGELILSSQAPLDTYVDLTGWGKGVIFVNGLNLGRYWPSIGSQVTLFVPKCHLRPSPQKNTIVVFETEYTPANREIVFTDKPILDKIPPTESTRRKMTIGFAAKSQGLKYYFKLDAKISRIN